MSILTPLFKTVSGKSEGNSGSWEEFFTVKKLGWVSFGGKDGKILQNLMIRGANKSSFEIDVLYISVKGLFLIRSMDYQGHIFGNNEVPEWVSTEYIGKNYFGLAKIEKQKFDNPIWQNRLAVKALKKGLGENIQTISFIVFPVKADLKSVEYKEPNLQIFSLEQLQKVLIKAWKDYPDCIDKEKIEEIYDLLKPYAAKDEEK